jgi:hypothetical protein
MASSWQIIILGAMYLGWNWIGRKAQVLTYGYPHMLWLLFQLLLQEIKWWMPQWSPPWCGNIVSEENIAYVNRDLGWLNSMNSWCIPNSYIPIYVGATIGCQNGLTGNSTPQSVSPLYFEKSTGKYITYKPIIVRIHYAHIQVGNIRLIYIYEIFQNYHHVLLWF